MKKAIFISLLVAFQMSIVTITASEQSPFHHFITKDNQIVYTIGPVSEVIKQALIDKEIEDYDSPRYKESKKITFPSRRSITQEDAPAVLDEVQECKGEGPDLSIVRSLEEVCVLVNKALEQRSLRYAVIVVPQTSLGIESYYFVPHDLIAHFLMLSRYPLEQLSWTLPEGNSLSFYCLPSTMNQNALTLLTVSVDFFDYLQQSRTGNEGRGFRRWYERVHKKSISFAQELIQSNYLSRTISTRRIARTCAAILEWNEILSREVDTSQDAVSAAGYEEVQPLELVEEVFMSLYVWQDLGAGKYGFYFNKFPQEDIKKLLLRSAKELFKEKIPYSFQPTLNHYIEAKFLAHSSANNEKKSKKALKKILKYNLFHSHTSEEKSLSPEEKCTVPFVTAYKAEGEDVLCYAQPKYIDDDAASDLGDYEIITDDEVPGTVRPLPTYQEPSLVELALSVESADTLPPAETLCDGAFINRGGYVRANPEKCTSLSLLDHIPHKHEVLFLDMTGCNLGECISGSPFKKFSNLQGISLSNCGIKKIEPDVFKIIPSHSSEGELRFSSLRSIDLSFNLLESLPEELFAWAPEAMLINLEFNKLTTAPRLSFAYNLRYCLLAHNKLHELPLNLFTYTPQIAVLSLSDNDNLTITYEHIAHLPLTQLFLEKVKVEGDETRRAQFVNSCVKNIRYLVVDTSIGDQLCNDMLRYEETERSFDLISRYASGIYFFVKHNTRPYWKSKRFIGHVMQWLFNKKLLTDASVFRFKVLYDACFGPDSTPTDGITVESIKQYVERALWEKERVEKLDRKSVSLMAEIIKDRNDQENEAAVKKYGSILFDEVALQEALIGSELEALEKKRFIDAQQSIDKWTRGGQIVGWAITGALLVTGVGGLVTGGLEVAKNLTLKEVVTHTATKAIQLGAKETIKRSVGQMGVNWSTTLAAGGVANLVANPLKRAGSSFSHKTVEGKVTGVTATILNPLKEKIRNALGPITALQLLFESLQHLIASLRSMTKIVLSEKYRTQINIHQPLLTVSDIEEGHLLARLLSRSNDPTVSIGLESDPSLYANALASYMEQLKTSPLREIVALIQNKFTTFFDEKSVAKVIEKADWSPYYRIDYNASTQQVINSLVALTKQLYNYCSRIHYQPSSGTYTFLSQPIRYKQEVVPLRHVLQKVLVKVLAKMMDLFPLPQNFYPSGFTNQHWVQHTFEERIEIMLASIKRYYATILTEVERRRHASNQNASAAQTTNESQSNSQEDSSKISADPYASVIIKGNAALYINLSYNLICLLDESIYLLKVYDHYASENEKLLPLYEEQEEGESTSAGGGGPLTRERR